MEIEAGPGAPGRDRQGHIHIREWANLTNENL